MASAPEGRERGAPGEVEAAEELIDDELAAEMARFSIGGWLEAEAEARAGRLDAVAAFPASLGLPGPFQRQPSPMPWPVVLEDCSLPMYSLRQRDRNLLDEWRFPGGDPLGRRHVLAPEEDQGASSFPRHASARGVLPGDAYVTPPVRRGRAAASAMVEELIQYLAEHEPTVLHVLSNGSPEDSEAVARVIVSYAGELMESRHGNGLLREVLKYCGHELRTAIIASVTQDRRRFLRICVARTDEVLKMIKNCRTRQQFELLRDAIMPWMAPWMMQGLVMDSNRSRVVKACLEHFPLDMIQFILYAVSKHCTRIACYQSGLFLLQICLERMNWRQKDDVFTAISYKSFSLAQNPYGNFIVQVALTQGEQSHWEIIASCFRHCYVGLSKQKSSSNVVEECLRIFDDRERLTIVNELVSYPHFRDLVTDEYANYVISTALQTCKAPLRQILASAILSLENVNRRHPHCVKIFDILSKFGYAR